MGTLSFKSVAFDGVNDHALGTDAHDFDHNVPFSVSCWFRTTDNNGYLVSKIDGAIRGWGVHVDASGSFQFVFLTSSVVGIQVATVATGYDDGVWHHAVLTYSGGGTAANVTLYVDGASKTKATPIFDNLASGTTVNAQGWQVNGRTGANVLLTAVMDEIAIYDIELTAGNVTTLYNNADPPDLRETGPFGSLVGYWPVGDDEIFPTLRDQATEQTPLLAAGSVKDRSVNTNDGTPTNMEDADFRAVILASELMPDLSGSGNAGTPTNMEDGDFTTDVPAFGNSRYAMTLGGTDEHVSMGNAAELDFANTDDFSVSVWVKVVVPDLYIVGKRNHVSPFQGYELKVEAAGEFKFSVTDASVNLAEVKTTATFSTGVWYHVVVTWAGSLGNSAANAKIYVDGVAEALTTLTDTLTGTISNSFLFDVGMRNGVGGPFDGSIDDVAVYDKALSLAEVQAVYNSGAPVDNRTLSTRPNLVGYWGCGDAGPGGVLRHVARMDGVNEYITYGNVAAYNFTGTASFSVGVWVRPDLPLAAGQHPISKVGPGGTFTGWLIYHDTPGAFQWRLTKSGTFDAWIATTANYDKSEWYHLVCTYNAGPPNYKATNMKIYVNGALAATSITGDDLLSAVGGSADFRLGSRDWDDSSYDGWHAGGTIHSKELSLIEVQALYNGGIPVDPTLLNTEPNLIGSWDFSQPGNDATMTNMDAGDIIDQGAGFYTVEELAPPALAGTVDGTEIPIDEIGVSGGPTLNFKMRGSKDPGPGFEVWVVQTTPDFAGSGAPGPIIGGTAVVADSWSS